MKVIRRCAVSLGKLFSWLLPVACTCGTQFGVMVFHYLLQLIRWLLRQTEKGVQRVATKLEMLNTPRGILDIKLLLNKLFNIMTATSCTCVWNLVCDDCVILPATTDLLAVKAN